MRRQSQIVTRRWQNCIHDMLAEIEALSRRQRSIRLTLDNYIADPDWPERGEAFRQFEEAGGRTSDEWAAWLADARPPSTRLHLAWSNPREPRVRSRRQHR